MGGPSPEHEVSLNSGKQILENLDKKKYLAQPVIITKTGQWLFHPISRRGLLKPNFNSYGSSTSVVKFAEKSALVELAKKKPDVAFIAMHGAYGEDGTLQGLLESIGMPYTGSGVLASALGMDKPRSCALFREAGFLVPDFVVITRQELQIMFGGSTSKHKNGIIFWQKSGFPLVVKPANRGSSVGISIVKNKKELLRGIKDAFKYSDRVILQRFIKGREITCGVLEDKNGKLIPLPPTEILPMAGKFYDYRSKYAKGGSKHVMPPPGISQKIIKKIQDAACRAHSVLGCSGMSRSDFILGEDHKLYILEINTIPGMTSTSLLPEAAKAVGIEFSKLLDIIIQTALR